jgi:SAM-dependent methyltransferase
MRDTDGDWGSIAETHPYFGVISNERYLGPELTPQVEDEFYASGELDIAYIADRIRAKVASDFAPRSSLDFGSGVGRLTFAMAALAGACVGVDVAEGMCRIARERALRRGVQGVTFRRDIPPDAFDWVNTLIVLQHIPPVRGIELLGQLIDRVAPGGVLSAQLTFYKDRSHLQEVVRDLGEFSYDGSRIDIFAIAEQDSGGMTMYDYDLNLVFRTLFRRGLSTAWVEHTDHAGCHGMRIFAQRDG